MLDTLTANDTYKFLIQFREDKCNHLLRCRELFQQFLVDVFKKVDTERLAFHTFNQQKLRADKYKKVKFAFALDGDLENIGKQVILASSYTGGPRYFHKKIMDAMTYCRNHGKPRLFFHLYRSNIISLN